MRFYLKLQTLFRHKIKIAAFLLASLVGGPVFAGTASSSFNVTASVIAACLLSSSPLAFGNYDPTAASATAGSTTVAATCTLSDPYTIALNNGNGSGANYSSGSAGRKMTITSGTATLGYNLYQDSGYTTVWGTTGSALYSGTGTGAAQSVTVYGRIPAQQVVGVGSYSDTISATISF